MIGGRAAPSPCTTTSAIALQNRRAYLLLFLPYTHLREKQRRTIDRAILGSWRLTFSCAPRISQPCTPFTDVSCLFLFNFLRSAVPFYPSPPVTKCLWATSFTASCSFHPINIIIEPFWQLRSTEGARNRQGSVLYNAWCARGPTLQVNSCFDSDYTYLILPTYLTMPPVTSKNADSSSCKPGSNDTFGAQAVYPYPAFLATHYSFFYV